LPIWLDHNLIALQMSREAFPGTRRAFRLVLNGADALGFDRRDAGVDFIEHEGMLLVALTGWLYARTTRATAPEAIALRRQANICDGSSPFDLAIADTFAPATSVSPMILAFSSSDSDDWRFSNDRKWSTNYS
jgi:hypothetical protein